MAIVAGYDVHRNQITFDALDTDSGEVTRGRIDSTREAVSAWVERFPGRQVQVAVEACTGWLFVCEALAEAGAVPHLAEPAEVAARRGSKRRAKTDRADARHLRQLLAEGRLPEDFLAGRYHSLAAITVPDCFEVSATAADGEVMAVRHRELPVDGVQFHPESVLTPMGRDIAKNFLEVV